MKKRSLFGPLTGITLFLLGSFCLSGAPPQQTVRLSNAQFTGKIVGVDVVEKKLTVEIGKRLYMFSGDSDTRIELEGKSLGFGDLVVGQTITLQLGTRGERVVILSIAVATSEKPAQAAGAAPATNPSSIPTSPLSTAHAELLKSPVATASSVIADVGVQPAPTVPPRHRPNIRPVVSPFE